MVVRFAGCCMGQARSQEAAGSSLAEASQVTSALTLLWPPLCHQLVPLSVLLAAPLRAARVAQLFLLQFCSWQWRSAGGWG